MKRKLLLTTIIVALGISGLSGCDDKNTDKETASPAKAAAEKPAAAPVQTPAETPQRDAEQIAAEKMSVYVKCFNNLQIPVNRSLSRYASWLQDFKKGPTGKEGTIYGIYGVFPAFITECQTEMKRVLALTPKLEPIDSTVDSYIGTLSTLAKTINEMDGYYTQENYKDDGFAKGKTLHQTLLKELNAFEPAAEKYQLAIQEVNDRRQLEQLKKIEASEGKTLDYYSLATMISAKQLNNLISQDGFDAQAAMKRVDELSGLVDSLKAADKGMKNFAYANAAAAYQLAAKKYVRRIRDKVAFTEDEKEDLQDSLGAAMVEDSYPAALKCYNDMVNSFNFLHI